MQQVFVKKGNINRIVFTDDHPTIKEGNQIKFKDENDFWDIMMVFPRKIQKVEINL